MTGDWIIQTPNLSGQSAAFAYLPSEKVAISVVSTFEPDGFDEFGGSVGLSRDGRTLVVGARGEDSSARGVNGSQADNSVDEAGAAYVFTR